MSGAAGDNVYIKYIYINADASTYNTLLDVDSVNFCLGEVGADYFFFFEIIIALVGRPTYRGKAIVTP